MRLGLALGFVLCAGGLAAKDIVLTPDMLVPIGSGAFSVDGLELPELSDKPLLGKDQTGPVASFLRRATAAGLSNGHQGVLYDNRDRGHSTLPPNAYPSLGRIAYQDAKGMDYGLAGKIHLPAIVLGNSSTALTRGARARSLTRLAMTSETYPRLIYDHYAGNHLYHYPEHRDHDEVDLYPANWPYTVTSQGSSGSDKAFLNAFAMTVAAIPKDTMAHLRENGLVVPTLQMLMRRNLVGIDADESYFTGFAHPTVFPGDRLRVERMIAHATTLRPDTIAPMVRIIAKDETFRPDAGLAGQSEILFDTPSAIARIWRGFEGTKRITLSAAGTSDPLGRKITFRWVLLRGDPTRVRITPKTDTVSAEIEIDWHDAFSLKRPDRPIMTSRIDIGVFAEIGGEPSAPAILSVSFPTHQKRVYGGVENGAPRLVSIDYDAVSRQAAFDPLLHWTAPWTDIAQWDGDVLTGWRRDGREVPAFFGGPRYVIDGLGGALPTLREVGD